MRRRRALYLLLASLTLGTPALVAAQETRCDRGDLEVADLTFEGNTQFSDAELAAGIVTTPSTTLRRLLRFVGTKHCLDADQLPLDVQRLRLWYRNHGFLDVSVDTSRREMSRNRIAVTFRIDEGPPMLVDTLRIEGLDAVPERPELIADLPVRVGGLFDRYATAAARDSLTRRLRDNGYPDAEAFVGFDTRTADRRATVLLTVSPGPRVHIGSIELEHLGRAGGAPEVRRSAVRRLMGLQAGDLYRERDLERAKRVLYQSEAFTQVLVEPGAISDSSIAVNVALQEGFLRAARLGGGWGSLDCFRTTADLTNYNVLGSATRMEFRGRVSKIGIGDPLAGAESLCPQAQKDIYSRNLNYYAGATLSRPLLTRASLVPSFSLYSERRSEYSAFLRTTPVGGSVALTQSLPDISRGLGYSVEYGKTEAQPALYCAVFNACESADRAALQRLFRLAVLSASGSFERTDDPVEPRLGFVTRGEIRHASQYVGAEPGLEFSRATLDASAYVPLGPDIVLATRVRLGAVFGSTLSLSDAAAFVPPQERLFAGGPTSVRGFRQNELGPAVYIPTSFDTLNVDGTQAPAVPVPGQTYYFRANADEVGQRAVPTGGNTLLVGNAELRFASPFLSNLLRWTVFGDIGELWNRGAGRTLAFKSIKLTPGAGFRLRTPIGFLRVDMAYNPYDPSSGSAYYDAPILAGGQLFCVSPGNTLPVTLVGAQLVQAQGNCPGGYAPRRQRGLFGRWTPSFAIGQAF